MKNRLILSSLLVCGMLIGGVSFANAYNGNTMAVTLSAEQQAKYDTLYEKHRADVAPLRDELHIKRMELRAFENNANVNPEQISALVKEIASLEKQIRDKRLAFSESTKKEFGFEIHPKHHGSYGKMHHKKERMHAEMYAKKQGMNCNR